MLDLLLAQTPALSADAKWIIGMMGAAIVALFVFMKVVLAKVFTLFENILVKEVEDFKYEIKTMHNEGIRELKDIKKHQNNISTNMELTKTHSKEAKHAIQNLPCNPIKDNHSEEQY